MKLSRAGYILALIYVLVAVVVALLEFNCEGGGLGICGLFSIVITLPAQYALRPLLSSFGLEIDFQRSEAIDVLIQSLNIGFCTILVYLIGWAIGALASWIRRLSRNLKS
jgi:hypothetical protein